MEKIAATLKELEGIFFKHRAERICILGTTCIGKTTITGKLPYCTDIDDVLFPLLSEAEKAFICKTPWTEEIGDEVDRLTKERVKIKAGSPLLGTVILDCDVIVYLDIEEAILQKHCERRGVALSNSLNIKKSIEADLKQFNSLNDKINYRVLVRA